MSILPPKPPLYLSKSQMVTLQIVSTFHIKLTLLIFVELRNGNIALGFRFSSIHTIKRCNTTLCHNIEHEQGVNYKKNSDLYTLVLIIISWFEILLYLRSFWFPYPVCISCRWWYYLENGNSKLEILWIKSLGMNRNYLLLLFC